jgi:dipeptidyl aminopeptidase/acylaminoacyl peptidase
MRILNVALSVSSRFFSISSLPAQNLNKHVINPQDVLTIRELYDVNLSPDGKQIAFVVNEPHDPRKPREPRASNVWVVSKNGQELPIPLIAGLNRADTPRWSPDGKTLAFLSDRGDAEAQPDSSSQIYLLRAGEKKAVRVSNAPGGVEEYHWSPDGKLIAFVAGDQMTPEEQAKKNEKVNGRLSGHMQLNSMIRRPVRFNRRSARTTSLSIT